MTAVPKTPFDLTGRTIALTGGKGLLGLAIARAAAAAGGRVIVLDRDAAPVPDCDSLAFESFDITDVSDRRARLAALEQRHGPIHGWVNCAYPRTADWGAKLENIPVESWRTNVDSHLNAYCLWSAAVAETMAGHGGGSIVDVASIYGVVGPDFSLYAGTDMTMPAAYAAIKGGIVAFSRYLASYYGKHGVRANAVCPGGVFDSQPDFFVDRYVAHCPAGRMARPDDVAWPIIFLLSDAAAYVTGTTLPIDGGWTAI